MAQGITQQIVNAMDFDAALKRAEQRAAHSYFDSHVVKDEDGSYITFDEGDYGTLPAWMIDRIEHTVQGQMADDY